MNAAYSCQESTSGPGPEGSAGCAGTVPAGAPIDTSTSGVYSFSVTATSQDTQTTTATSHYTVISPVGIPPTSSCPAATRKLSGLTLALIRLWMTRAQALEAGTHSFNRGKRYEDFFCLTPTGIQVGYASERLLRMLTPSERRTVRGRVVLALTANPLYSLRGVRPGASLAAASHTLHTGAIMRVGLNDWYTALDGSATAVLKVRHGTVQEIGIASKIVTHGRSAQLAFIKSFS